MLQTQTVYPETLGILKSLMQEPLLNDFYLLNMIVPLDWEEVKKEISIQVKNYLKK